MIVLPQRLYGVRHRVGVVGTHKRPIGLPARASSTDLTRYCTYVDNQIGDRCVGDAIEGARWIAVRGEGQRGSPRGIYVGARAREVASAQAAPLIDIGCDPQDAIDGCVESGVFPRDARDDDFEAVTALDTWGEAVAKKPFDPGSFVPLDPWRLDIVDQWLTAGFGVVVWFSVDQSWSSLNASSPTWRGVQGQVLGGHATVLVGYQGPAAADAYIDWNSYGPGWGRNGFALIPRSVLQSAIGGAVAITGGPIL